ncbi:MAG: stage III sporulation protein AB [Eubacteriales bacterium]
MKLLGCILVGLGCGYLGILKVLLLKQKAHFVGEVAGSLERLQREIYEKQMPIPIIFLGLSKLKNTEIAGFYRHCLVEIKKQEGRSLHEIWEEGLPLFFERELAEELAPLGTVLGMYQKESQKSAILAVIGHLNDKKSAMEGDNRRLGQVYPTLGVSMGIFILILLL